MHKKQPEDVKTNLLEKRGNATAATAVHDPYFERIDLSFSNTKECFRNKSTYELVRSIMVFKVGSMLMMVESMIM